MVACDRGFTAFRSRTASPPNKLIIHQLFKKRNKMRQTITFICFLVLLMGTVACCSRIAPAPSPVEHLWTIELFDPAGKKLATLNAQLVEDPSPSTHLRGHIKTTDIAKDFPYPNAIGSTIDANVAAARFTADLNAGMADNNVILDGMMKTGEASGKWSWASFAGGIPKGTFTLKESASPSALRSN